MRWMILIAMAGLGAQTNAAEPVVKFSYSTPAETKRIPALTAYFATAAARLQAAVTAQATADKRNAARQGYPFHPYEAQRTWKVVTDTPRFLSLSLETYDYTGGAHGNSAFATLLWDKTTHRRMQPIDLFTSAEVLRAAIRPAFCRQLDAERKRKRGGTSAGLAEFDKCIDPVGETVILGSSTGRAFDRIGILIAPYEAGPYAEGTYEVTLPVTPVVLAAVKPAYRRYVSVAGR